MNQALRPGKPTGVRASVIEMLNGMEADPGVVEPEESAELIRLAATGEVDDLAGDAASIYDPGIRRRITAGLTR
jgi:hypothetical protein